MVLILLIVPEGIEIIMKCQCREPLWTFNRTRRNWNFIYREAGDDDCALLIVPEGIEMFLTLNDTEPDQLF